MARPGKLEIVVPSCERSEMVKGFPAFEVNTKQFHFDAWPFVNFDCGWCMAQRWS